MGDATKSVPPTKHVVIVGAGFAGLNCAKRLASDPGLQITLIDKTSTSSSSRCSTELPTGLLSPEKPVFNLRDMFFHRKNVDVKMSEASHSGTPALESPSIGCGRVLER